MGWGALPTGPLPTGALPIGAFPTLGAYTGAGSRRGRSAAAAAPTIPNVAAVATSILIMTVPRMWINVPTCSPAIRLSSFLIESHRNSCDRAATVRMFRDEEISGQGDSSDAG